MRSSIGSPVYGGGSSGSLSSSGLQETIRTQGRPLAGIAGKAQTLSSTIASGCKLVEDLDEPLVDVACAVEQGLPGRAR